LAIATTGAADSGGERTTAIYLLSGTAKLSGSAPEAWLRHLLVRIAYHPAQLGRWLSIPMRLERFDT